MKNNGVDIDKAEKFYDSSVLLRTDSIVTNNRFLADYFLPQQTTYKVIYNKLLKVEKS
jgi:hypothetical protein